MKKKLAIDIVGEELLLCGGEWKTRKAIYEELLAEGHERKYVECFMVELAEHQPKEENRLKTLQVTASKGDPIPLCPKCHEVKEEFAAFFKVPLYPEAPQKNEQGEMLTTQPELVEVLFRPMCYCQCEREQPSPMSCLFLGCMVHHVSSTGRHEPSVVVEIFDRVAGSVKLRNLYTLVTDTCTYSETPVAHSWHWIEEP